jgi:hypothetical protein
METFKIKISPEVLSGDIFPETYDGFNFGVYSGLSMVLSGGPNGSSLLTGLTIPIMLTQDSHDFGYYSTFDGNILQQNIITNFVFSANSASPYTYYFYNTSDNNSIFTQESIYNIDWGDNTTTNSQLISPNYVMHTYNQVESQTEFTITLTQTNTWGVVKVKKTIVVPFTGITIENTLGTVVFVNNFPLTPDNPTSYNYIFSGDSITEVSQAVTSNFVDVPYVVSGFSESRLFDLVQYGPDKFPLNVLLPVDGGGTGKINNITTDGYIYYEIDGISYVDFTGGTTTFSINSSGFSNSDLVMSAITKNEALLNIIDQPQIFSSVLIERGKNSVLENFRRIGEVDTVDELVNYGYGFFNVISQ